MSDTVFDREVELGGARYVERVWLGSLPGRLHPDRRARPGHDHQRDTEQDGELGLRFQFALVAPGTDLPITEAELSDQMKTAYVAAVQSTLAAVRSELAGATTS